VAKHLLPLRPVVLRGCATDTLADVLERWATDDYLGRLAPEHKTASDACSEPLVNFLGRYNRSDGDNGYRRCSELPEEMLQEVTTLTRTRTAPHVVPDS
jgi:hypothetical protein